jgi:hypothetical protein
VSFRGARQREPGIRQPVERACRQIPDSRCAASGMTKRLAGRDDSPRNRRAPSYLSADDHPVLEGAMIYILAFLLPPLGLLLNGQPFSAIFNLVLIVPCLIFGLLFPVLWLVPSIHGVVAVHMRREDRRHREIVDAIEKHGPPPWWLR